MSMPDFHGPADEAESIATIHVALEAGAVSEGAAAGERYAADQMTLLDRGRAAPPTAAWSGWRLPEGGA